MKKNLIAFGILGSLFFGGSSFADISPAFEDASDYATCKEKEGIWISAYHKDGENCLKKESCDGISFVYKKKEEGKKLDELEEVNIKSTTNGSQEFEKKECGSEESDCSVKQSEVIAYIEGIDTPEENPEWYCPSIDQLGGKENPYDPNGTFFKNKLKDSIYEYLPERNELVKNCSLRMFALNNACVASSKKAIEKYENVRSIKTDFLKKREESVWRGEIVKGDPPVKEDEKIVSDGQLERWKHVGGKRFKDIYGKDDAEISAMNGPKKEAFKDVQEWLGKTENATFRSESMTPEDHVEKIAKKEWESSTVSDVSSFLLANEYKQESLDNLGWTGSENAVEKITSLLSSTKELENSAKKIQEYVSKRNLHLNINVSINQTSELKVTDLLRVSEGSREADLVIFNDGTDSINIIDKIIRLAVRVMGTLAVFLLIISGVLMIVSQGDENDLAKGKKVFTSTLIGLVVGFLSYTIVRFIIDTLLS